MKITFLKDDVEKFNYYAENYGKDIKALEEKEVEKDAEFERHMEKIREERRKTLSSKDRKVYPLDKKDMPQQDMPQRITEKVGRNEPCPCGSGKKYKKCCGSG